MKTTHHRYPSIHPFRLSIPIAIVLCCCMTWLLPLDPMLAQTLSNSRYDILVRSGDTVPGSSETFTFLGNSVASQNGQWAVFEADYTGTVGRGLFRVSLSDGTVTQVIADNDPLSGANYDMGVGGIQLSVNSSGTVGFNARLANTGSTNDDSGIYSWNGSSVTKLVREGDAAPGGSGGTFLSFGTGLSDAQFRGLNDQGQTMFSDSINNSPSNPNDDWRFFQVSDSAPPAAIATEGDPAPNGGLYQTFQFPEMNDQGQAVIQGSTSVANLGTKIYRKDADGSMHELVNAHSAGTSVGSDTLRAYGGNPSINNLGEVAFIGWTTTAGIFDDDTHLIKLSPTGDLTVVLTEGTAAPDGNGEFKNMLHLNPRFNDASQYASVFELRGTTGGASDDRGIFRVNADGSVTQIFREGQTALDGNGNFGNISTSASFGFNDAGMVAMETTYVNTSNGNSDNLAIVVSDGIDSFEVAREGNTVGGLTILDLEFNGGVYGNDRSTSGLNQYGQVLYSQSLSGGNRGLVLWTPELHHRGGNTDFGDGQNWTLSLTPGQVHDVFLDSSTSSLVNVNGSHTVNNLQVGGGSAAAQLHMLMGSDITVNQALRLDANGSIVMDNNTSLSVGSLTGSGSISATTTSDLIVFDMLSPGQSPGILNFGGNLSLASSAMTQIELAGIAPGQFDQVVGLNDLDLDGNLTVLLDGGFALADGMTFDIFQVNGTTTGQFLGLGEGALVGNFGGTDLFITYQGGSGNYVSLYTSAIPEPGHAALVLGIGCLLFPRRRKRDA